MSSLLVRGGQRLTGRIEPSANKNAVLPVLCATLLTDAPVILRNVPEITDVERIVRFFAELGSTLEWDRDAKVLSLDHSTIPASAKATLPQAMRASITTATPRGRRLSQMHWATSAVSFSWICSRRA